MHSFSYRLKKLEIGLVLLDRLWRITDCDAMARSLLGRPPGTFWGCSILDLHPPSSRQKVEWLLESAAHGPASLIIALPDRTLMVRVVSLDADERRADIGEPLASSLYRIVQEALTNVARHAAASEVRVGIRIEGDDLVLWVVDNGKGIDLEAAARSKSYGIMGIRERAGTLGGSAQISRVESGGTRIDVVVPMARYRERKATHDPGSAG